MDRPAPRPDTPPAVYDSYVLRVWRARHGGPPTRVDVEHVQSGRRASVDVDAFADLVARVAAGFPAAHAPPPDPGRP